MYFKEAKQHLGLLKEQSNHYAAYIASIHLTTIRFCMLMIAKQIQNVTNVVQVQLQFCKYSTEVNFISKLWKVFRAIISGALDEMKTVLDVAVTLVQVKLLMRT